MNADLLSHIKADIDKAIREELLTPALVERGYGWIEQLRREFPIGHRLLMAVLSGDPESALKALGVWDKKFRGLEQNPVAVKYVGLLQARLNGGK